MTSVIYRFYSFLSIIVFAFWKLTYTAHGNMLWRPDSLAGHATGRGEGVGWCSGWKGRWRRTAGCTISSILYKIKSVFDWFTHLNRSSIDEKHMLTKYVVQSKRYTHAWSCGAVGLWSCGAVEGSQSFHWSSWSYSCQSYCNDIVFKSFHIIIRLCFWYLNFLLFTAPRRGGVERWREGKGEIYCHKYTSWLSLIYSPTPSSTHPSEC